MAPNTYIINNKSERTNEIFNLFAKHISLRKRNRILKQRVKQNTDNMLIGEILARVVIKKTFGIDIAKQKFAYTEQGKPYLSDYPDVHFNISHSGDCVMCAVSDKPVGVDIQKIGEYNSDVAKRVCNENELVQIENSENKASEFTKLWTQKEAVLKMYGTGIAGCDIKNCLNNKDVRSERIEDYWLSVSISIDKA